ncbi:MAG: hypothetical protein LBI03_07540 [Clostridiales bacterium]|jgi:hypothetical protein|nr:hypothetical protein [Clostridiales bacterium]
MGYSCKLTTSNKITKKDIQEIINNLPDNFKGDFPKEQPWGWSLVCDICLIGEKEILISGSYGISFDTAKPFVRYLTQNLNKNGHKTKSEWNW